MPAVPADVREGPRSKPYHGKKLKISRRIPLTAIDLVAGSQFLQVQDRPSLASAVPDPGHSATSPPRLDHDCKDPRRRADRPAGVSATFAREPDRGAGVGQRHHPPRHARRRPPDRGGARRPPVRRARRSPRRPACPSSWSSAPASAPTSTASPTPTRWSTPSAATRSTSWPWPASAPSSAKPIHDAFPDRIVNTHPALLPAFKGWHAVDDALAAGREGHRLHRARRAPRGRRRPDPRPGGGAGPRRRHRRDAARAHQGGRAAASTRAVLPARSRSRTNA